MFKITDGKGFQLTFDNGNTISVQFGYGNYCENRTNRKAISLNSSHDGNTESSNAEIGIWYKNEEWITRGVFLSLFNEELGDEVEGYLSSNKVAELINYVANLKASQC